jgi:hypothetical protein
MVKRMSIKINVAVPGEQIIDGNGYVYTVEAVHDKYVSIGNGEYIMHHDYKILSKNVDVNDINHLIKTIEQFYKKYGFDIAEDIESKIVNRLNYINEGEHDPRHIFTFEQYEEHEGDNYFEYEKGHEKQSSS